MAPDAPYKPLERGSRLLELGRKLISSSCGSVRRLRSSSPSAMTVAPEANGYDLRKERDMSAQAAAPLGTGCDHRVAPSRLELQSPILAARQYPQKVSRWSWTMRSPPARNSKTTTAIIGMSGMCAMIACTTSSRRRDRTGRRATSLTMLRPLPRSARLVQQVLFHRLPLWKSQLRVRQT